MGSMGGSGQKINEGNFGRGQNDFIDTFIDVNDPFDLMGTKAAENQAQIAAILTQSAQAGIAQQEQQEAFLQERYQGYYDQGVNALGKLSSLYSGDVEGSGYTQSATYDYQLEKGREGIDTQQAKSGLLNSSSTAKREAGLVSGLAAEDMNRYEGGLLSQIQMGAGSAEAMSAASQSVSGNIGSLYGALGQGLNTSLQNMGQARQASMGTLGNSLSSAGAYMGQQG